MFSLKQGAVWGTYTRDFNNFSLRNRTAKLMKMVWLHPRTLLLQISFFLDFINQGAEIAKRPINGSRSNKCMFPDFIEKIKHLCLPYCLLWTSVLLGTYKFVCGFSASFYSKLTWKGRLLLPSLLFLGDIGRHGKTHVCEEYTDYFDSISQHPLRVRQSKRCNIAFFKIWLPFSGVFGQKEYAQFWLADVLQQQLFSRTDGKVTTRIKKDKVAKKKI